MKIVIAGLTKTGTTGLFYKIKNSLKGDLKALFEPGKYLPSIEDSDRTVLAKIVLYKELNEVDYESFDSFDKKVLIIRDPRDRLISQLLFQVLGTFYRDEKKVSKFLDLLKKKEENPRDISVLKMVRFIEKLNGQNLWKKILTSPKPEKVKRRIRDFNFWKSNVDGRHYDLCMEFHSTHKDYFIFKYEDFISGRIGKLEEYLGFSLSESADPSAKHEHIARTKASGNWKNWFLKEDIDFYKPLFSKFMEKYDYLDEWKISDNPVILPENSSQYVTRIVSAKRNK